MMGFATFQPIALGRNGSRPYPKGSTGTGARTSRSRRHSRTGTCRHRCSRTGHHHCLGRRARQATEALDFYAQTARETALIESDITSARFDAAAWLAAAWNMGDFVPAASGARH